MYRYRDQEKAFISLQKLVVQVSIRLMTDSEHSISVYMGIRMRNSVKYSNTILQLYIQYNTGNDYCYSLHCTV